MPAMAVGAVCGSMCDVASERVDRLARITSALLDPTGSFGTWRDAACALFDLCSEIAPLAPNEVRSADHEETFLSTGKAISAVDAARCIQDVARTRAFLTGVERAIRLVGRPAHVLYAGTGPFAPLVVPLTSVFDPDALRVTMIDIHPSSVERVHAIIAAFGLEPYVESAQVADATAYDPSPDPPVDVLVVETMQRALTREPQVAIVRHLLGRLPQPVRLIPETVVVSARLTIPAEPGSAGSHHDRVLGEVLRFDASWARRATGDLVPCTKLRIEGPVHPDHVLTLDTRLTVAPGVELTEGSSGLTLPHPVWDVAIDRTPCEFGVSYRIDDDPGLVCVGS